jgi:hypothetical protein
MEVLRAVFFAWHGDALARRDRSISDLVRLSPSYERFLALCYYSRDECRDPAQRAFERLATSHVALGVMRVLLLLGMNVSKSHEPAGKGQPLFFPRPGWRVSGVVARGGLLPPQYLLM